MKNQLIPHIIEDALLDPLLLNIFPIGILISDASGIIIQANHELHRLFGYDDNQLIGSSITQLVPLGMQHIHAHHIENFFTSPQKRVMGNGQILFGQRKDNSTFPIEIGLNPVTTHQRTLVVANVTDITLRQHLASNFEKVVQSAPIGVLIINEVGKIVHANRQLSSIFGYPLANIIGQNLEMLIPERHREHHVLFRTEYSSQPTVRAMGMERDLTGLHANGTEFPVEIGLNPIETESGRQIVAIVTDITHRKKAELKLRQLNSDLDEFTYVASHDLKSPLRGIASLLEWIEEDLGENISQEVRRNLERIHLRIDRMEKLVEDLLTYARSGRQQTETKSLSLKNLIEDVINFIDAPKTFSFEVSGFLGDIKTYATPLETILRNLIANAVKHHDKDTGTIRINVAIDESFCRFDVIDDGPGIPSNAHERIFKLFQTLSGNENNRSGVGLAVCKRMVESHGGKIEVICEDNIRGSCFRFWWPRFARSDIND